MTVGGKCGMLQSRTEIFGEFTTARRMLKCAELNASRSVNGALSAVGAELCSKAV
jgi:hypothetical protein